MKRLTKWMIVGALVLGIWALPCWAQGENPPAAQAGKTSGHGMTAVEQTPGYSSGNAAQQVKALEKEFTDALMKNNVGSLDRLMADDYVNISAASGTNNKQQYLDALRRGDIKFESINLSNEQIRLYGGDTAVLTGTTDTKALSKTKGEVSGTYQFTRIWVKKNGRWQTVNFQSTPVSGTQSATKEH